MFVETDQAAALELARGLDATASNIERVAGKTSPEAARWAFTQWELRAKAVKKGFPRAEEMLFTREALEQASHFAVARYHASLFPSGELVADLTCGIGSDLLALAERGPVIGFDIDTERLEYARHNLGVHGLEGELVLGNCLTTSPDEDTEGRHGPREWHFDYAMADPSRRVKGRRTLDMDHFSPKPSLLSQRLSKLKLGLIKLSPMIDDKVLLQLGHRLEFVSYDGECREALVICDLEPDPEIFAVRAETGGRVKRDYGLNPAEEPLSFVYQLDPAIARAKAGATIRPGDEFFRGLGSASAYATSAYDMESCEWIVARFRVLEFGKGLDIKEIRGKLQRRGSGRVIVKGQAGFDVAEFAAKLRGPGAGESIVIVYPMWRGQRYAIVEAV